MFKVGDRVRLLTDVFVLKQGDEGTVITGEEGFGWCQVNFFPKGVMPAYPINVKKLELIVEPKFKVGDRVRLIQNFYSTRIMKGAEGVIEKSYPGDTYAVRFGVQPLYSVTGFYLELVTEEQEVFRVGDNVRAANGGHEGETGQVMNLARVNGVNQYYVNFRTGACWFTNGLERITEEKVMFKIGDKVKVIDGGYEGQKGVITNIAMVNNVLSYVVNLASAYDTTARTVWTPARTVRFTEGLKLTGENKFKAGDRVKLKYPTIDYLAGTEGTVIPGDTEKLYPIAFGGSSKIDYIRESYLELAPKKEQIKKGDKVRLIVEKYGYTKGAQGIVAALKGHDSCLVSCLVQFPDRAYTDVVRVRELELVKE